MKLTQLTVAALCVGMTLVACQKDKAISGMQSNKQLKGGDPAEDVMAAFFEENRENATEYFTINPHIDQVVVTEEGTEVHIMADALRNPDGSEIDGLVTVSVLDNYSRGAAAMSNMPMETTRSEAEDDNGLLASAGSFDFDFRTADGGEVINPDGGVEVEAPATNFGDPEPNPEMKLWEAAESPEQERDLVWQEMVETPEIVGDRYKFPISAPWKQINLDARIFAAIFSGGGYEGPFAYMTVDLPAAYDQNNAEVFIFFSNAGSTIPNTQNQFASMDTYDGANQWWKEHWGIVAVGTQIYIVGVGIQNGGLYAEIKSVTVSANNGSGGCHTVLSNMQPTTVQNLTNAINNLQ